MSLVDLRVAPVKVALIGWPVEWFPEAHRIERAGRMLTPHTEVRDVVLRRPATGLGWRRIVAQRKQRALSDPRSLKCLQKAGPERIAGHAGSITALTGAVIHGSAISTKRHSALTSRICSGV